MKTIILRIFDLIKKGELRFMIKGISKRILSKTETFGLKRDLNIEFKNPDAHIDIMIRPYEESDKDHFKMDLQNEGLIEKEIPTCYVATNSEDVPCYRQWLIGPKQNIKIKKFWGQSFPTLKEDEALIESVFRVPTFSGKQIMPAAMGRISKKAKDLRVQYLILFVEIDNIPSLKGCHRSGFSPYVFRIEKWVLFKRTITFQDVQKENMDKYHKDVNSSKTYV